MKRLLMFAAALIMMAMMTNFAAAGAEVKGSGQIRVRFEFDDKSFNLANAQRNYTLLRTRVNVEGKINDNVNVFVQFQDSRRLGEPGSGALEDGMNVDIHQAFFKVNSLWENGIGIKAGRFEVNLGNERVFGAVGWDNVGRSWEGFQLWKKFNKVAVTGYWLKKVERDDNFRNADFDIFGFNADIASANLELFAFMENDALRVTDTIIAEGGSVFPYTSDHNKLQRINLGMYYHRTHNKFDFEMNGVYQLGQKQIAVMTDATTAGSAELDIAAFMVSFEAGYSIDNSHNPRCAVGIDYTSGDDDAADDKDKTYDNLYYTGHKFRGYMDYFVSSGKAGLIDIMFRGKCNPREGWTLKGDFHYFKTAADYVDFTGSTTNDAGIEVDFSVTTSRVAGTKIVVGGSVFLPSEAMAGMTDPETAFWGYTMIIANF